MLRLHFLHHRKLLPILCRCAWDSLMIFLHEALDRKDVFPGGILVPQTFGGMANWNPHVHGLVTDVCWDREGNFYPVPEIDTADVHGIEKLFAGLVFRMLLKENMISKELVENMNSWKIWDVDALKCPKCGGRMKVISFIEQPSVIRRILKHLDLWEDPRPPPQPLELVCEPCADYVPWKDDVPEIEVG